MALVIAPDDPRAADVTELLGTHLAFSHGVTPVEFSFALDVAGLIGPDITFFSAREDGQLLGVAALKRLDATHAELKSMHTRADSRGRGVGRALVDHILGFARTAGYRRMSLETGTTDDFIAARTLYTRAGFTPCEAFGDYQPSPYNTFFTIELPAAEAAG